MGGLMSRNKGKVAERAVVNMLNDVIVRLMANEPEGARRATMSRNLEQVRKGGCDVIGLDWASIEVKHHKVLAIPSWWAQTVRQTKPGQQPILIYKQNRTKWRVRMLGRAGTLGDLECIIDISIDDFLKWFGNEVQRWHLSPITPEPHVVVPATQTQPQVIKPTPVKVIPAPPPMQALVSTPAMRYPAPWETSNV